MNECADVMLELSKITDDPDVLRKIISCLVSGLKDISVGGLAKSDIEEILKPYLRVE